MSVQHAGDDVGYTVVRDGNLERKIGPQGQERVRLVRCPLCDADLSRPTEPWRHFFDKHGPTDAGLSPLSAEREGPSELGSFGGEQV